MSAAIGEDANSIRASNIELAGPAAAATSSTSLPREANDNANSGENNNRSTTTDDQHVRNGSTPPAQNSAVSPTDASANTGAPNTNSGNGGNQQNDPNVVNNQNNVFADVPDWRLVQDRRRWFFEGWFEGVASPNNHDPLVEVVRQYPGESVWFVKVIMVVSVVSCLLLAVPALVFLCVNWTSCRECDQGLHMWVLAYCYGQLSLVPVRLFFLYRLQGVESDLTRAEPIMNRLTMSLAWRIGKFTTFLVYFWYCLGVVWVANANYCDDCPGLYRVVIIVITFAMLRMVVGVVCFYHSFPLRNVGGHRMGPRAASKSVIEGLPVFSFGTFQVVGHEAADKCAVCLSEFEEEESCRMLPCGHIFHKKCIDKWLERNQVCPLCLGNVEKGERKSTQFLELVATMKKEK